MNEVVLVKRSELERVAKQLGFEGANIFLVTILAKRAAEMGRRGIYIGRVIKEDRYNGTQYVLVGADNEEEAKGA